LEKGTEKLRQQFLELNNSEKDGEGNGISRS
jgi:hypothetical protein